MNKHLRKILGYVNSIRIQLKQWFMELTRLKKIIVVIITLLILVTLGRAIFSPESSTDENASTIKEVSLSTVGDMSDDQATLPLLGTITSTNEAIIRAESSGKLTRVYKKLGDTVVAGQVIAEFENGAERAALLQAEGAYDQAKAGRDIARINSGTTNTSLVDVQTSALNTISSAYITMDDSIRVKTDGIYTNPRADNVKITLSIPDAALSLSLEAKRRIIEKLLTARDARNRTLTAQSDLLNELQQLQVEAQTIKQYLDDLSQAYAKAVPDVIFSQAMIDGGKASVGGARSSVGGTISSIIGAKTSLTNSIAAQEIAGKTSGNGGTGVATADATVKQALGAYNGALSRLEKTVIRSSITGTLNSLSIKTGDFISAFTQIGVVSNNGALEVITYVTEDDAKRVVVGNTVTIDGNAKGIITRVASALDPQTKKIEVRIGITEGKASLINGQSVRVEITRAKTTTTVSTPSMIPLSALKITPKGTLVFTVGASSTLVAIPVTVGALMGDRIQILSGVTNDTKIVTDARGLKEGITVSVTDHEVGY